uniref:Uncharacterized protein n=1 Tax=Trypanosoma vivax (strain Y486) TaxID=1055687 RepID=G0U7U5_TRYVY|nr:hypothetical protein TVY486_1009980 [Trypanosoma vivax Y486]
MLIRWGTCTYIHMCTNIYSCPCIHAQIRILCVWYFTEAHRVLWFPALLFMSRSRLCTSYPCFALTRNRLPSTTAPAFQMALGCRAESDGILILPHTNHVHEKIK